MNEKKIYRVQNVISLFLTFIFYPYLVILKAYKFPNGTLEGLLLFQVIITLIYIQMHKMWKGDALLAIILETMTQHVILPSIVWVAISAIFFHSQ